jgi:hypothetical protein
MLELEQLFYDGQRSDKKVEEDFYLLHRSSLRFFDHEDIITKMFQFELTEWNNNC